jgi:hypothetical protein
LLSERSLNVGRLLCGLSTSVVVLAQDNNWFLSEIWNLLALLTCFTPYVFENLLMKGVSEASLFSGFKYQIVKGRTSGSLMFPFFGLFFLSTMNSAPLPGNTFCLFGVQISPPYF